jgi:hypothetical protein
MPDIKAALGSAIIRALSRPVPAPLSPTPGPASPLPPAPPSSAAAPPGSAHLTPTWSSSTVIRPSSVPSARPRRPIATPCPRSSAAAACAISSPLRRPDRPRRRPQRAQNRSPLPHPPGEKSPPPSQSCLEIAEKNDSANSTSLPFSQHKLRISPQDSALPTQKAPPGTSSFAHLAKGGNARTPCEPPPHRRWSRGAGVTLRSQAEDSGGSRGLQPPAKDTERTRPSGPCISRPFWGLEEIQPHCSKRG